MVGHLESDPAATCLSGKSLHRLGRAPGWWTDRRPRAVKTRPPVSSRAPCHSVNHPCEEGGRLERHGVNRASLSGRARPPGRFTFHGAVGGDRRTARYAQTGAAVIPRLTACPGWDSNPHCRGPEPRASYQLGYLDMERLTGFEPATSALATPCSGHLSYNRVEPPPRFDSGPRPYQGRALTARA